MQNCRSWKQRRVSPPPTQPRTRNDDSKETMMKTLLTLAAAGLCLATATATASPYDPGVNRRQANQAARIGNGVGTGELTGRETRRLVAEQRGIAAEERFYKRDGVLLPWERVDLRRDQNAASRDIRLQKRDGQRRF
jgi:hypothetical protein